MVEVWGLGRGAQGLGVVVEAGGIGDYEDSCPLSLDGSLRDAPLCWGLGFGVWGSGFMVWGLGFGVWGLGLRA